MKQDKALIPAELATVLTRWHDNMTLVVNAGEMSPATVTTYRRGMHRFVAWCMEHNVTQVTKTVVRQWVADELTANKPRAVNTWLAGVRAFYSWANDDGVLGVNPTAGVRGPKRKGTAQRHYRDALTDEEVKRLLAAPQGDSPKAIRDRAILYLFVYTAVRTVELHRADVQHLRTKQGRNVMEVWGKGKDEAEDVVIPGAAFGPVSDWIAVRKRVVPAGRDSGALFVSLSNRNLGQRLSLKSYRELVKGYMEAVGIVSDRKTTHSLRHTAITKLVQAVGPTRAMTVSRHSNIDTLMIYHHEQQRLDDPPEEYIDYGRR